MKGKRNHENKSKKEHQKEKVKYKAIKTFNINRSFTSPSLLSLSPLSPI
jgi:hypothetical protein